MLTLIGMVIIVVWLVRKLVKGIAGRENVNSPLIVTAVVMAWIMSRKDR